MFVYNEEKNVIETERLILTLLIVEKAGMEKKDFVKATFGKLIDLKILQFTEL